MHVQFLIQPGQSLIDASLPAGETRSVRIDNPSGSWLQLFPTYDWVAPYTLGFARTFDNAVSSITVRASDGPAGQISTTDGDAVRVILDSRAGANSAGSSQSGGDAFIEGTTPLIAAAASLIVPVPAGVSSVLFPVVAGSRYRVRSLSLSRDTTSLIAPTLETYDAPTFWRLRTSVGLITLDFGMLSASSPVDDRGYSGGLDFPVGEGVEIVATGDWAQTYANVSATAERI